MQTSVIKEQVTCFLPFMGIKSSTPGLGVQHHQYSHSTVLPQRQDMIMGSSPQALLCDWLFGHHKVCSSLFIYCSDAIDILHLNIICNADFHKVVIAV